MVGVVILPEKIIEKLKNNILVQVMPTAIYLQIKLKVGLLWKKLQGIFCSYLLLIFCATLLQMAFNLIIIQRI